MVDLKAMRNRAKGTDSRLATDRKHEGRRTNGAENKRIMSLEVLCKSQSEHQCYKEKKWRKEGKSKE